MKIQNNNFYGSLNSFSSRGFIFDKIYPNRAEMEANQHYDDVFLGRFVLVDYYYYPTDPSQNNTKTIYDLNTDKDKKIYEKKFHGCVFIKTINGYLEVISLESQQNNFIVDENGVLKMTKTITGLDKYSGEII